MAMEDTLLRKDIEVTRSNVKKCFQNHWGNKSNAKILLVK